ncbi:MAG TPA: flagellar motor switch protein FliM, partial [Acetobacteraceae bacterium]|nr:flagellar motor switch protein FliM [Acetobacteraceae bacterium]
MSGTSHQQQSDEELAATGAENPAGETAGETPGEPMPSQPARVLNQAEIDSLLGFDDGPGG